MLATNKYLGALCKRGHDSGNGQSWRYNNNSTCVECSRARIRTEEYKQAGFVRLKAWAENNSERHNESTRAWRAANAERMEFLISRWNKNNPERRAASCRSRQARKLQAMPVWADKDAIIAKYADARRVTELTGIKHEVDHIIPLQGKNVSGLHVPDNLQVLTVTANRQKSNKFLEV